MWAKSYPQHCICFTWPLFNSTRYLFCSISGLGGGMRSTECHSRCVSLITFTYQLSTVGTARPSVIMVVKQRTSSSFFPRVDVFNRLQTIFKLSSTMFESLLTFIICVESFLCQLAYCRLTVISSTTVNVLSYSSFS